MSRADQTAESHIAEVHRAEQLVDEVEQTRERLRGVARKRIGVTGEDEAVTPLRQILRAHSLSIYPLFALGLLNIVDEFAGFSFSILAPEIAGSLGLTPGQFAMVGALSFAAGSAGPLLAARFVQSRPRRALLAIVTGIVWAFATIALGFVVAALGLVLLMSINSLTTGAAATVHVPLLLDSYPPEGRVRAVSFYGAANALGKIIAPLAVALIAGALGYTWRVVFMATGTFTVVCALLCVRLRDPGFGRWDTQRIRATVRDEGADDRLDAELGDDETELGFFEVFRRLLLIPTTRRLLFGFMVWGMSLGPYSTFINFFLAERWDMGPGGRGVLFAAASAVTILVLILFGKRGDRIFRDDPRRVVELYGWSLFFSGVVVAAAALSPWFWLMVGLFVSAGVVGAVVQPAAGVVQQSILPAAVRSHVAALTGIFVGVMGGILGAALLGGVYSRYGPVAAIVSLLIPNSIGSLIVRSAGKFVPQDMDRMIDEVIEEEEIERITAAGEHLPMLSCRHIDFSYGQIQVLFDVDFTVDDGEIVALLGTNGAGKSTLLKVISGIGLPSRGSVRFRGADITYLDAERRVGLGITQVPGGRAVFGRLSVADNLKSFAYTIRKDRRAIKEALDLTIETFPRLAERWNQKAITLSGGEQQMLGLSKALLLQPRLLLIDELSLGLAPVIVAQLLDMVRAINARGTAVVLVEQSVNIALSVVDHAYFMEKGEIRFDGSSTELMQRDDLLRAVFLGGAGAAV
ncbi:MAG: MFS transporter [Actinobacteria bacterium]|nr:MFS transporter [Actinomycetota bacterium]